MTTRRTTRAAVRPLLPAAAALAALVALVGAGGAAGADDGAGAGSPAGVVALPGEDVELSSDADAPTPVTAGAWRGDLGPVESDSGEVWFEYRRETDDATLLVSAVSPGADPAREDALELEVLDPAGDRCTTGAATSTRIDGDPTLLAVETVVGVQEAVLAEDEDGFECLTESRLLIRVARGTNGEQGRAPFTLRVVEESPLVSADGLPGPLELGEPEAPDVDAAREDLPGGAGLEDAPEAAGGRYRGTTTTDRTLVYRVPDVGWGQTLRTALAVEPVRLADGVFLGPDVELTVLSPMGTRVGATDPDGAALSDDRLGLVVSAGPVRYLNRRADLDAPPYVPGDHYVLVTVEAPDEGPALEVDYTLEVEVAGEEDEPPDFVDPDAYLLADGDRQPVVRAVGAGGLLAGLGAPLRYGGAALLALGGLAALTGGVRTLRA
ncbi:hypothetical protein [Nocardioides lentus]|uniref:hypothetical protein n=1 Tax=Nocardioides lentus TaxID=338077 RepID=UPI0031E3559D